jgi:hypothetical protein
VVLWLWGGEHELQMRNAQEDSTSGEWCEQGILLGLWNKKVGLGWTCDTDKGRQDMHSKFWHGSFIEAGHFQQWEVDGGLLSDEF